MHAVDRTKHLPERSCIGCKAKRIVPDLLRLACTSHGEVILDRSGCAPGRGAYVCSDAQCLRDALRQARLVAAFKQSVVAPAFETIYQAAILLLYDRLGACLSMAQKAGTVVSGYTSLHKALAHVTVAGMILAEDIAVSRSEEYRSRCAQYAIPCLTLFTKEELGRLIGRPNRSAVGLTEPRFYERLCATRALLETLRSSGCCPEAKPRLSL